MCDICRHELTGLNVDIACWFDLLAKIVSMFGEGEGVTCLEVEIRLECWKHMSILKFAVSYIFLVPHPVWLIIKFTLQEHFLVPDHTIKDISGASFAGFYYICFQKTTATIEGYYYHRSSEWYG